QLDGLLELADGFVEPAAVGQLDAARVVLVGFARLVVFVPRHATREITQPPAAGLKAGTGGCNRIGKRSVAAGGGVLAERLEVLGRLDVRLHGGVVRLVAGEAVGGAGEQLADVAAEDGDHADGRDGDQ